jgi:hypothetical protein
MKLEAVAAVQAPSGFVRGRDAPGGSRRWRRLREAGKITGFRIDGHGREFFYRVADIAALMVPAALPTGEPEPETTVEIENAKAYAEAHLGDLLRGGNRAA